MFPTILWCAAIGAFQIDIDLARQYQGTGVALRLWQDTVAGSPHKARPHMNLARAYQMLGRYQESISEFRNAILVAKDYERPMVLQMASMNMGQMFIQEHQLEQAKAILVEGWNANPGYPGIAANLGLIYLKEGHFVMATQIAQMAIRAYESGAFSGFAGMGSLYYNFARAEEALGNCRAANEAFKKATRANYDIYAQEGDVTCDPAKQQVEQFSF